MKRLIHTAWISLDGFIAGPDGALDWVLGDGRLAEYETDLIKQVDTTLFGRTTYDQLAPYWSTAETSPNTMDWEKAYAPFINGAHHVVVSHGLKSIGWGRETVWPDLRPTRVEELKAGPGKSILIYGSASIVQQLTRLGLIDEYQLLIHPVLLGTGKRLFDGGLDNRQKLERVEAEEFQGGIVKAIYRPA